MSEIENKCTAACKRYEGGEVKHHRLCFYYPDSFSRLYDELQSENDQLSNENKELKDFIRSASSGGKHYADRCDYLLSDNDRLRAELSKSALDYTTLAGENERLRAELEAIRSRVPSNSMIDAAAFVDSTNEIQATGFHLGARWMRNRIFPPVK